jgi:hypothetical protein
MILCYGVLIQLDSLPAIQLGCLQGNAREKMKIGQQKMKRGKGDES